MTVAKIQPTHCDRLAYVYVRQSTPWQVPENRESTERQYHLQARAIALGWSPSRVEIIDEDQGRTGSTAAHRTGFQRLVSEVGLGRVGMAYCPRTRSNPAGNGRPGDRWPARGVSASPKDAARCV